MGARRVWGRGSGGPAPAAGDHCPVVVGAGGRLPLSRGHRSFFNRASVSSSRPEAEPYITQLCLPLPAFKQIPEVVTAELSGWGPRKAPRSARPLRPKACPPQHKEQHGEPWIPTLVLVYFLAFWLRDAVKHWERHFKCNTKTLEQLGVSLPPGQRPWQVPGEMHAWEEVGAVISPSRPSFPHSSLFCPRPHLPAKYKELAAPPPLPGPAPGHLWVFTNKADSNLGLVYTPESASVGGETQ
ncbi:uncharacterized protein LOC114218662 [Eumetopias jubatus]|uniref:uncharacterized protein LOC114218662 n=1 Tax=Eumetopias jubatus TaxID=34886 RepID=UPI0010171390|nr:uncharacterized protein LOC114218662 [Eumetopias jubatus]